MADIKQVVDELASCLEQLRENDAAGPLWGQVHKLLLKTPTDKGESARVIMTRDLDALEKLIRFLRGEEETVDVVIPEEARQSAPAEEIPAETLKKAMRAFRKRLKLTKLDHESKLGGRYTSSGRQADFDAIVPPNEFPREVWETLVEQGQLARMGSGFYKLVE